MKKIIIFEIKKFFLRKKNIIGIILIALITAVYILSNINIESKRRDGKLVELNFAIESMQNSLNQVNNDLDKYKDDPVLTTKIQDIRDRLNEQIKLFNDQIAAIKNNDWKKELTLEIQIDKIKLQELSEDNIIMAESPLDIQNRLTKNEFMLKNNIKPIYEDFSMTPFNFIRKFCVDLVPLIFIILLFMLSSDLISNEFDEGTFRFMLIQPISRIRILLSKIIATTLSCLFIIGFVLTSAFIILGMKEGFGSSNYPVLKYIHGNYKIINMDVFVSQIIFFLVLLIITIVAISTLISTIFVNSTTAICISIVLYVSYYILDMQIHIFNKVAQFLPFTYCNITSLYDGSIINKYQNSSISSEYGIIILLLTSTFCYLLSGSIFRRKEVF